MKLNLNNRVCHPERNTSLKVTHVPNRGGFSLVEVTLALLVVSIGLISLIGLFPASLDMSKRSINETYASFLADSAFASYKEMVYSTNYTWSTINTYKSIGPNTVNYDSDVFWENSLNMKLLADGQIHTIKFTAGSTKEKWKKGSGWILADAWNMEDHALRYRLTMINAGASDPRIKKVLMEVWMGEFGDITKQKPEIFYTELFRHEG